MHAHASADDVGPNGRRGCSGACHSCGGAAAESGDGSGSSIRGFRMIGAALLVFVLPLTTALAGARWGGSGGAAQIGGAFAGLLAGALVAQLCVACSRALREEAA